MKLKQTECHAWKSENKTKQKTLISIKFYRYTTECNTNVNSQKSEIF